MQVFKRVLAIFIALIILTSSAFAMDTAPIPDTIPMPIALGMEASAIYEASVQRGCKLSGEVAHIIKNEAYNKLPDELKTFDPDKPESRKKVLWQGEYQLSN